MLSSSSNQGRLRANEIHGGCGGELATAEQFRTWKVILFNVCLTYADLVYLP